MALLSFVAHPLEQQVRGVLAHDVVGTVVARKQPLHTLPIERPQFGKHRQSLSRQQHRVGLQVLPLLHVRGRNPPFPGLKVEVLPARHAQFEQPGPRPHRKAGCQPGHRLAVLVGQQVAQELAELSPRRQRGPVVDPWSLQGAAEITRWVALGAIRDDGIAKNLAADLTQAGGRLGSAGVGDLAQHRQHLGSHDVRDQATANRAEHMNVGVIQASDPA